MLRYEFAIKKDVLNSGKTIFTPVCREKSRFPLLFVKPWNRIVKIYDHFSLQELEFNPDLSYTECEQHIVGYQELLLKQVENNVATVEFHTLETKQIT